MKLCSPVHLKAEGPFKYQTTMQTKKKQVLKPLTVTVGFLKIHTQPPPPPPPAPNPMHWIFLRLFGDKLYYFPRSFPGYLRVGMDVTFTESQSPKPLK